MTYKELLEKIKKRGYWKIHFEPLSDNNIPLIRCKEVVVNNSVELRGWDYPHIPKRLGDDTGLDPGNNFWQGWLDWNDYGHHEFWRMFQSSQFIHYRSVSEDWREVVVYDNMWINKKEKLTSGQYLGAIGTVYLITEIYQFLFKLAKDGLYEKGVRVNISLINTENRQLYVDDFRRVPFFSPKKTVSNEINFKEIYTKDQLLNDFNNLSLKATKYLFERFNWIPDDNIITTEQQKLLSRKI